MYFKITLLLVLVLNSSCKWVGEKPIETVKVNIKNNTRNCFQDLNKKVESYLKSEITEDEINNFFNCTEAAVDDFMRKTAENNPKMGYSRDEIKGLLKTFMLKDKTDESSEKYSRIFLIFKRMLIGGPTDHLTRDEWKKIKFLFPLVKKFFNETKSYTQYYYLYNRTYYQNKNHDFKRLAISHDEFKVKLLDFLAQLKDTGSALNKFELQYIKDELVSLKSLSSIEPLLNEVIYIFYSFPVSQYQENWGELFKLAEGGLRITTYVKKANLQKESFFVPRGGVSLAALLKSIIDVLDEAYHVNSSLNLEQELIERLMVSLNLSKVFFKNVTNPEDIRQFVANAGRSLFTLQNNNNTWYISDFKLNYYKFLFNRWVDSLIKSIEQTSSWDLKEQYNDLKYSKVDFDIDAETQAIDINENISNPSLMNLVFPGMNLKINFEKQTNLSQSSSVITDFYKTMISNIVLFVFDTYGKQSKYYENAEKSITEQTAKRLYDDLRPLAVAEGFASPLICDAGGVRFLEANLFGYSSNGNDKMEVQEAMEWFSTVISTSYVTNLIFDEVLRTPDCSLPGTSTFLNKPYLKKECVKGVILKNYERYFNHLPSLLRFIKSYDKLEDFYQNLFEVTRMCNDTDLPFTYDEILYSVSLLQFIENLFEKYDVEKKSYYFFTREKNDFLEYDELKNAFNDRFKSVLQRIAKVQNGVDLSESNTSHLFDKLLIYKKIPPSPKGTGESLWWWASDRGVKIKPLNRIDIYKIFNSILTMGEKPDVTKEYCQKLTLAYEEYVQLQVFDIQVQVKQCEPPIQSRNLQQSN